MTDLVQEFSAFLKQYDLNKRAGVLQPFLDRMGPEKSGLFKLAAIPHQFNAQILMVLAPGLSEETARARCAEFGQNPSVRVFSDELYVINEELRDPLFKEWLEPDRREEFTRASRRLVDYFSERAHGEGIDADTNRTNRVFHLIGADRNEGFTEFEKLLKERQRQAAPGEREILIRLIREYDPILTSNQRATLSYHEGKIATDLLRGEEARKLFNGVLLTPDLDPVLHFKSIIRLGLLENNLRNWSAAIGHFKDALALLDTIENPELKRHFNYRIKLSLGITYREMGELQEAKRLLLESLRDVHKVQNTSGMAVVYNSLGTLFRKIGEARAAIKAYLKSLKLVEQKQQSYRLAQVYNNLGLAYLDDGRWEKGQEALQKSLTLKATAGDTIGLGRTYNNLMQAYRVEGKQQEAITAGGRAIECFEKVGDYYDLALAMRNRGRLFRALGDKVKAQQDLEKARQLFERSQAPGEAMALQAEINYLTLRTKTIPWWAWILYSTALLLILAMVVLGAYGIFVVFMVNPAD